MTASAAQPLVIGVFGLRWRLDDSALFPEHADLAARLRELWSRASVTPDGTELDFAIALPGQPIATDENGTPRGATLGEPASFPYVLSRAITLASISVRRGSALLLHAAGLAVLPRMTSRPADPSASDSAAEIPVPATSLESRPLTAGDTTIDDDTAESTPAFALIAESGTGKSTAVCALGASYGYLSDETVVVEGDLAISAYPKPISLAAQDRPHDKDEFSPDELGLAVAPAHTHVGATVLLLRDSGVAEPSLAAVSLIDAVVTTIPQTSSLHLLDRPLARLAQTLTAGGGPYELVYADIASCTALLAELVDALPSSPLAPYAEHSPTPAQRWSPDGRAPRPTPPTTPADETDHVPITGGAATDGHRAGNGDAPPDLQGGPDPHDTDGLVAHSARPAHPAANSDGVTPGATHDIPMPRAERAPWTDALEADGEVLVLTGTQPMRLSGIGATIWLAASAPTTLATFIERTIAAHGHHPYERTKTAVAVEELLDAGLLVRPGR